jgi:hypothetical protein
MYGETRNLYRILEQFKISHMREGREDNINSRFICPRIGSVAGCYKCDLPGFMEGREFRN